MKRIILLVTLMIFFQLNLMGHGQQTHKYMTVKAYELVKDLFGDIPTMKDFVGTTDNYYNGDYPFQRRCLTTGAYREDEEDLVFGFDGYLMAGWDLDVDDWIVSITHFWDADNGDDQMNHFVATLPAHIHNELGTFPNAFQKMMKFAYPNKFWEINFKMTPGSSEFRLTDGNLITINHCGGVGIKYNSLVELFKTGHAWITHYYSCPNAEWEDCNYEVILGEGWRNAIVWEILGRMCHLLEDMSVPAHSHNDEHGYYTELYEYDMSNSLYYSISANEFNNLEIVNPYYLQNQNPLHFLMTVVQQVTDHYASCGNDYNGLGDDNLGGNITNAELTYINNRFDFNNLYKPVTEEEARTGIYSMNIRANTYFYAVEATAGLLYWFASETGLISKINIMNNFVNGTIKIGLDNIPLQKLSPFVQSAKIGQTINLEAQNQIYDNIERIWNNTGVPNSISHWLKRVGSNTTFLQNGQNNSYSFAVTSSDNNSTYIANLMKNCLINQSDQTEFDGTFNYNPFYLVEQNSAQISTPGNGYRPGSITYNFAGWIDDPTVTQTTRTITPITNLSFKSLYKYKSHTNTTYNGNNGQRTFFKDSNWNGDQFLGYLHNVYCSMGKIWYERSTDNGVTWEIMNNGRPINLSENAKSPSIWIDNNLLYVVYQVSGTESYWPFANDGIQVTALYTSGISTLPPIGYYSEYLPDYNYNTDYRPVIAGALEYGTVIYDMPSTATEGIKGFKFKIEFGGQNDGDIIKLSDVSFPTNSVDQYSANPSIACDHLHTHVVFERAQSQIRHFVLGETSYSIVSNLSTEYINIKPTISLVGYGAGNPVVSWIGATYNYSGGYTPTCGYTRVGTVTYSSPYQVTWGSTLNRVNGNISSISSASNGNLTNQKTLFTWSYLSQTQYLSRWQRRDGNNTNAVYTTPAAIYNNTVPINGISTQAATDESFTAPKALVFKTITSPFSFNPSTTNFLPGNGAEKSLNNYGGKNLLSKITENDTLVTFGRSGIVSINDIQFVFETGDVIVGDSLIRFIDIPDTIVYSSVSELNQHTRTNNFTLTPNTSFYFSNIYHVVKKSNPDSALSSTDAVNFRAELVNATTDQVAGTFDNITYNKNNVEKYASIDYLVDCSGITQGEYYLRLVTAVNGNGIYALENIFNESGNLAKKSYNKVNFIGSEIPETYDLVQNFPNPFNPNTTIRYQIPKSGNVTLKIYDVLGAEVTTLVNEEKVAGKYEVSFNASKLASGVYIYRIQAGDFVSSKKMVLLK
jgi:hypothetical protein